MSNTPIYHPIVKLYSLHIDSDNIFISNAIPILLNFKKKIVHDLDIERYLLEDIFEKKSLHFQHDSLDSLFNAN